MNKSMVLRILGMVIGVLSGLLLVPFIVGLFYHESSAIYFLYTSIACLILFLLSKMIKIKDKTIFAKEGLVIVSLSWIIMSAIGAIPLNVSGAIPSYIDAFFETVSGFTTTGSSILTEIESLPRCVLFWRSFTHWIGGMGVLVFLLSISKIHGNDHNMHLMRAESPGPMVGKLLPKIRQSASLLYKIYTVMTVLLIVLLAIAGMPLFDAVCNAFGAAGTGGFGILNGGIGQYDNVVYEVILSVFMFLFGVNFNFYFYLMIWDVKSMKASEEVKTYVGVTFAFILLITLNLIPFYENILTALRHSSFQVSSIITTTGYASCDFNLWPQFSKTLLYILMFVGACAGSTGGGVKISRWIIIVKKIKNTITKLLHPRSVRVVTFEGKVVHDDIINEVFVFFVIYIVIFFTGIFLISLNGFDFETTISAVATCLGNVGPGFNLIGPMGNFSLFSNVSKIILSICMLLGRLEIFPLLITMLPMTYKRNTNL